MAGISQRRNTYYLLRSLDDAPVGNLHHGNDSGRGLGGEGGPERAQLPADAEDAQEAQEEVACIHPYILWWSGKCEGCRLSPLSPNLPDHRARARITSKGFRPRSCR